MTPVPLKEQPFTTADAFLDHLLNGFPEYDELQFRSPWVFRGHNDARWQLMPPAWRTDGETKLAPLKEKITRLIKRYYKAPHLSSDFVAGDLPRAVQDATEAVAVKHFCALADELGMEVPGAEALLDLEDALSVAATGRSAGTLFPGEELELFVDSPFAFAQHHGIPTRYLDWTWDPVVAAFFAADGADPTRSESICVWATRTDIPKDGPIRWVSVPRSRHSYLHAQHGLFSVPANDVAWMYSRLKRWPSFIDCYEHENDEDDAPELRKVTLPTTETRELRELLFTRRVSRAHMMPAFDNVAAVVRQRWEWYRF